MCLGVFFPSSVELSGFFMEQVVFSCPEKYPQASLPRRTTASLRNCGIGRAPCVLGASSVPVVTQGSPQRRHSVSHQLRILSSWVWTNALNPAGAGRAASRSGLEPCSFPVLSAGCKWLCLSDPPFGICREAPAAILVSLLLPRPSHHCSAGVMFHLVKSHPPRNCSGVKNLEISWFLNSLILEHLFFLSLQWPSLSYYLLKGGICLRSCCFKALAKWEELSSNCCGTFLNQWIAWQGGFWLWSLGFKYSGNSDITYRSRWAISVSISLAGACRPSLSWSPQLLSHPPEKPE